MKTEDRKHLEWIYSRLIHVHEENANYDYMIRFRRILKTLGSISPSVCCGAEVVRFDAYGYYECLACGKTYRLPEQVKSSLENQ